MTSLTDQRLLQDYAEHRSEAAFAELVRRHVDLVYSAAVRMVCDGHLAEDVTQRVFMALARNAARLAGQPVLSGWLHRTARNLAAETVRADVRRRAREHEAAFMNNMHAAEPDALWEDIAPHLDSTLGELAEADRDAVLLRYFERKSAREMAQTLGISEDAAQRRVSRAVERLRDLFAKRGLTVGAGGLVVVLSAQAVQAAPAGLAAGIATAAAGTAGATGATVGLIKLITMTKLQTALIGAIAAGAVVAPLMMQRQAKLRRDNEFLSRQVAQLEAESRNLGKQIAQLKRAAAERSASPAEPAPATRAVDQPPPFQQVTSFLLAHQELPREQIEAYLQQNHRSLESLLAAFQVSHDLAYLREAATNSPSNPAVQFAVIANNLFPEEQRKWIDAFKASSPDNALAWYFSAAEYFKSKQPDQAIQELSQGTRRQFYDGYPVQSGQAVEEMYTSAGWPALAAKAGAPGTASSLGPYVNALKALANDTLQAQQQYAGQGDASSANSLAALGMQLGDQLRRTSGFIDQLVGIAIEKKILAQLDPAASYDFLGRPVSQVLTELDQQRQNTRQALQIRDQIRPTLNENELNNYWDREKLYGEMYAIQWLQSKYHQP